jgi:SAM-dependent methyltransferase
MNHPSPQAVPRFTPQYLKVRYSQAARPFTSYPEQLCQHLKECYLGDPQGRSLVDLGCGRGEFLDAFSALGFNAQGIDREGNERTTAGSPIRICDLEKSSLPLADASIDIIFNKSVFEHVREITPLLYECRRVLKPGGLMMSMVPDFQAQWRHFYDDWTHVRPFTLMGLRECLQSHEFDIVEAKHFRQLPVLWKRPYLRPFADAAALLPAGLKRSKWVRFSKEWMLLAVAQKPSEFEKRRGHDD